MKVQDIFRIERNGEFERFYRSPYTKLPHRDRRLLWHGSRSTNFGGILSQGLRIAPPEAPANGYMFGKGIYLADMSSKSANYCVPYSSGNVGLLLLCEVELCHPLYQPDKAEYDAAEKMKEKQEKWVDSDEDEDWEDDPEEEPEGECYSTWARGSFAPTIWKDAGCVHENLKGVMMVSLLASSVFNPLVFTFLIPYLLVYFRSAHISSIQEPFPSSTVSDLVSSPFIIHCTYLLLPFRTSSPSKLTSPAAGLDQSSGGNLLKKDIPSIQRVRRVRQRSNPLALLAPSRDEMKFFLPLEQTRESITGRQLVPHR